MKLTIKDTNKTISFSFGKDHINWDSTQVKHAINKIFSRIKRLGEGKDISVEIQEQGLLSLSLEAMLDRRSYFFNSVEINNG